MRGELYLSSKDVAAAQADFDAVQKLALATNTLPLRFANAFVSARLFEPAVRQFDAWIAAHPKDANRAGAHSSRCRTRALWGRELEAGLSDCDEAMRAGLRTSDVMENRGLLLLRLGRAEAAISQYDDAIRMQPKYAWSLYGRGLAKLKTGKTADGRADIAAAEALQPNIAFRVLKDFGVAPDEAAGRHAGCEQAGGWLGLSRRRRARPAATSSACKSPTAGLGSLQCAQGAGSAGRRGS